MSKKILKSINNVYDEILSDFGSVSDKTKIDLIYAFNGTGKTRLTREFTDMNDEDEVLCFNSMFLDEFAWDNEEVCLKYNINSQIARFIIDQGLENSIEDNFEAFCDKSVNLDINSNSGYVSFYSKDNSEQSEPIKISKAEESIFIWSIFYTYIDSMIYELDEEKEYRSTDYFNNVKYLIIDDPVSSIDDIKIINIAIKIFELIDRINKIKNHKISILITTHHALFYNSLFTMINRTNYLKLKSYVLSKKDEQFILDEKGESPFGYHLTLVEKIEEAIKNGSVEKIHFNMFRILLEKTANYFGYRGYGECFQNSNEEDKKEIMKLINLYSHGNLSDYEYSDLTENQKKLFIKTFNEFINYYKIGGQNE